MVHSDSIILSTVFAPFPLPERRESTPSVPTFHPFVLPERDVIGPPGCVPLFAAGFFIPQPVVSL
jgi:hypothetical protein